jgi:anti-anti-sigma factor
LAIHRRLVDVVEVAENEIHIIRLRDIFDASTLDEFEKVINYILARNYYQLVVDLSNVEFISSAGWGAFTAELRRVRQNQGDIKLAGMNHDVYDVFLLLELDSFITAYETVHEAVAAFLSPTPAKAAPSSPPVEELEGVRSEEFATESGKSGFGTPSPIFEASGPGSEIRALTHDSPTAKNDNDEETNLSKAPREIKATPSSPEAFFGPTDDAQDAGDEFETQDIRDPWLLDEIDTLPEEGVINEQEIEYQPYPKTGEEFSSKISAFTAGAPIEPLNLRKSEKVEPSTDAGTREKHAPLPPARIDADRIKADSHEVMLTPNPRGDEEQTELKVKSSVRVAETARRGELPTQPVVFDTTAPRPRQSHTVELRKLQANGNLLELIRNIVFAHPHYGPTMIRRFLEARVEPPVQVSRSTVYRYLRGASLNTRQKRLEYAGYAQKSAADMAPSALSR